jgi:hypothetical protein
VGAWVLRSVFYEVYGDGEVPETFEILTALEVRRIKGFMNEERPN